MNNNETSNPKSLRQRAEELLDSNYEDLESIDPETIKSTIHELRVHQIELELQNEELRRTQEELAKSSGKFSKLYDFAPVGYLSLNEDGVVLEANLTFLKMVGAERGKILKRPFANLLSPVEKQAFLSRYRAFFKYPLGKNLETEIVKEDGSVFYAQLEGRLEDLRDSGSPRAETPVLLMTVADISERHLTRLQVEKQANFLETLLSNIPNPVFYKDMDGRYTGCNQAFEDLTGRPREEFIGKTAIDLLPDESGDIHREKDLEFAANPAHQQYDSVVVDGSGVPRRVIFFRSPIYDRDGAVTGIVGSILDITERITAEEILRYNAKVNAHMAEVSAELLAGADINNVSFSIVEKARELTGSEYGYAGYIDRNTGYLTCPTFSSDIWTECRVYEKRAVFKKNAGLWGWVLDNGKPLLTNDPKLDERSGGVPEGHIAIHRFLSVPVMLKDRVVGQISLCNADKDYDESDLSVVKRLASLFGLAIQRMWVEEDLRQAKEAAEKANLAKSNFLATMSHEIRTPMNAVLGFTDMTLATALSARQRENLEIVASSAKRLMNLLNDILDLSKIEAGRIEIEERVFDPWEVVRESVKMMSLRAKNNAIQFSSSVDPELPHALIGDRHRLYQVLFNLINNAIKFTEKGMVVVDVRTTNRSGDKIDLSFSVKDTGIGIPKEKQKEIFEPFTQADSSTTRQFGGTGLGLTISKKLVEGMGGEIRVESRPGEGSTFNFKLPFRISREELVEEESIDPGSSVTQKRVHKKQDRSTVVLLVEDNLINQKLAAAYLGKRNYRVILADNGAAAVNEYLNNDIDIILMDIEMPGMNGMETTMAIRRHEEGTGKNIPIVAMTAHAMKGDRERFLAAGMDGYLTKPIQAEIFYNEIDRHLSAAKGF